MKRNKVPGHGLRFYLACTASISVSIEGKRLVCEWLCELTLEQNSFMQQRHLSYKLTFEFFLGYDVRKGRPHLQLVVINKAKT